jgi:hypothetical protein
VVGGWGDITHPLKKWLVSNIKIFLQNKALKGKHNTNGNEAKTSDNQPETTEKLPKYESQCLILL